MYIVAQNRESVVNIDMFAEICLSKDDRNGYIMAKSAAYRAILGKYTKEKSEEIFGKIIEACFPADEINYEVNYFRMPEE